MIKKKKTHKEEKRLHKKLKIFLNTSIHKINYDTLVLAKF